MYLCCLRQICNVWSDTVQVQSYVFMLSSSDLQYVVRYCSGSVVGLYALIKTYEPDETHVFMVID